MVPAVQDTMENCPSDNVILVYVILSGCLGVFIFLVVMAILKIKRGIQKDKAETKRAGLRDDEFTELQVELYGTKALHRLMHMNSSLSLKKPASNGTIKEAV
jgi:hypothetical protein